MFKTQFSSHSRTETGLGLVVCDASLTLLVANRALLSMPGGRRTDNGGFSHAGSLKECLSGSSFAELKETLSFSVADETSLLLTFLGDDSTAHTFQAGLLRLADYPREQPVFLLALVPLPGLPPAQVTDADSGGLEFINEFFEDMLFEYNIASDTMYFTSRFENSFGLAPVIPDFSVLVHHAEPDKGDILSALKPAVSAWINGRRKSGLEFQARTKSGKTAWFTVFSTIIDGEDGHPDRVLGSLRNISRQKREQLRLMDKARTDSMTGLLNKQAAREEIVEALKEAGANQLGVLMMLDIDNFKNINDTMGRQTGDMVIIQIAQLIQKLFRKGDILGRVGGDEFHIYMRDVRDMERARERAAALCRSARTLFTDSNLGHEVSLSVGVAQAVGACDYETLYGEADIALYRAKANGKDQFIIFGEDAVPPKPSPLALFSERGGIMLELVEMLHSCADPTDGIERAIRYIGKALQMDRVSILERDLDKNVYAVSHEWAAKPEWYRKEEWASLVGDVDFPAPNSRSGVYYVGDTASLSPEERALLHDDGVTSLVQCQFSLGDSLGGIIRFEERSGPRIWSDQETDTLLLMATLIGDRLRRRKTLAAIQASNRSLRTIMDSLPGAFIFVTRKDNHRLLYFNEAVRERFPGISLDEPCYRAFFGIDRPCQVCVFRGDGSQAHAQLHYNTVFGETSSVHISEVLWEGGVSAWLTVVYDVRLDNADAIRQQRLGVMREVVEDAFDNIMFIDPKTGAMELMGGNELDVPDFSGGDYDNYHDYACDNRILSPYNEEVRRTLKLENLRRLLDGGPDGSDALDEVVIDFPRLIGGQVRWKRRKVRAFVIGGQRKYLTYNKDVTDLYPGDGKIESDLAVKRP